MEAKNKCENNGHAAEPKKPTLKELKGKLNEQN
jgi:hypothetical protein